MNEKFTPGPILKEFNGDARWILTDTDGYPVADVYGGHMLTDEANANLFAAAPDLYEALKFAFPLFTHMPDCSQRITPDHACDCGYSEAISESGAALAKAQGE